MEHIISSGTGVVFAELATIPICTIKTNKILYPKISGYNLFRTILKRDGIVGFYNASIPAVFSQIISTTSKYTFYKLIQQERKTNDTDIIDNMINGALGGIGGSFFSHPFDVMRTMKQNNQSIRKEFKFSNAYRGYSKSITKSFILGGFSFPIFDFCKTKTDNIFIASILTTIGSSLFIYPIEYMKIRHMIIGETMTYESPFQKKYYTGYGMHMLKCIPHFTIMMVTTEKIKQTISSLD
jgi:hypothetical protein